MGVRRRRRVAEPAGVGVRAHGAVGHADELVARIGAVAPGRLPRTQTGPSPMLSVAEAKPSFVPAIVSRNGARWSRSGSSSRGPTCGVPESLVFAGNGSPGVERLRAVTLPDRVKAGAICSAAARSSDAAWPAAVGRDRPDVEAAARERARGVGEQAAVAAPGRQRDDLLSAGQPLQATAVAPDHVQARGALAGILAHEGDPAPVGRPVGIAVAAAARHLPVADVEIAVTDGDDGWGEAARGLAPAVFQATAASRGSGASATAVRRSRARPAMPPYAARRGRTACAVPPPKLGRCLRERRDRADAHVLAVEELEPRRERPLHENGGELGCELVLGIGERTGARRAPAARSARRAGRRTSARARRR